MRKLIALLAVFGVVFGMAGAASAKPPHYDDGGIPLHGHVKLIVTYEMVEGELHVAYRNCIELRAVPNHAHHRMLHTGDAGGRHWYIPMAPVAPYSCEFIADVWGWQPNTFVPLALFD